MTEETTVLDDIDRLGLYANVTNTTDSDVVDVAGDDQSTFLSEGESYIFIATAVFSICYFLVGVTCCRCYWLHLRKKSEHNRSTEGGLETVVSKKDGAKCSSLENIGDSREDEEPNEFLEPKWS